MIKGVTKTGFKYEITKEALENYELLETISEVDDNPLLVPKVVKLLLGKNSEALKEHVRNEDGIVPIDKMMAEIEDIFQGQTALKK